MTRKCCVRSCGLRLVNMHKFPPKNTKRFKRWVLALRNPALYKIAALNEDKYLQVCHQHFSAKHWITLPDGKKKLHRLAVPDINLVKHGSQSSEKKTVLLETPSTSQSELLKQEYTFTGTDQDFSEQLGCTKSEPMAIMGGNVEFHQIIQAVQESPVLDDNIIYLPIKLKEEIDHNMTSLMTCIEHSELYPEVHIEKIPQNAQEVTAKAVKRNAKVICGICLAELPQTGNLRMDANVVMNGSRKAYHVLESISKFKYSRHSSRYVCPNCFVQIGAIAKFQTVCNKAQEYCETLKRCEQVLSDHKYNLDPSIDSQSTIDLIRDSSVGASDTTIKNKTNVEDIVKKNTTEQSDDQVTDAEHGNLHPKITKISNETETNENKAFLCKHCGKKFKLAYNLLQHESCHNRDKSFKCSRCNDAFWEEGDLRRHLKNQVTSTCEYCSKQFCRIGSYKGHLKIHETLKLVEDMTPKTSVNDETLSGTEENASLAPGTDEGTANNIMAKLCLTPSGYLCNMCGRRFKRSVHFLGHFKAHTEAKTFKCEYCGNGFWTKYSLDAHKQITFACGHCSSVFCTKYNFKEHVKTHVIHLCATCGLSFSTISRLRSHEREHRVVEKEKAKVKAIPEPKYTCKYCGQKFWRNITYATHVDLHENVPKYLCKFCGKMINTLRAYRAHESAHKAKGTFPCSDCDKVFSTKRMLQRHVPTHSDERRLMCNYCGKTFRLQNSYRAHMKIHTRKNLHKCQDCGKEFIQRLSWKFHVARFHGGLGSSNSSVANVEKEEVQPQVNINDIEVGT